MKFVCATTRKDYVHMHITGLVAHADCKCWQDAMKFLELFFLLPGIIELVTGKDSFPLIWENRSSFYYGW